MDINKLKKDGMIKELKNEQRAKLHMVQNIISRYIIDSAKNPNETIDIQDISILLNDFKKLEEELKLIKHGN